MVGEDITANIKRNGTVAIGPNATANDNYTLVLDKHPAVDATTYQLQSTTTATSPILTADRTTYGGQFSITNNKTEDIAN